MNIHYSLALSVLLLSANSFAAQRERDQQKNNGAEMLSQLLSALLSSSQTPSENSPGSALRQAFKTGNLHEVQRLITPSNVNTPAIKSYVPLLCAISLCSARNPSTSKIITFLCDQGAWIQQSVAGNPDPLAFACTNAATTGNMEIVRILIQRGGNPLRYPDNIKKPIWDDLLQLAQSRKEKAPFVYDLLDVCLEQSKSIHKAAMACNPEKVRQLLASGSSAVAGDSKYRTPLFYAVLWGSHAHKSRLNNTIALLTHAGANPNGRCCPDCDQSLVHVAVREALNNKTCRVLKALLINGASPLARVEQNGTSITPLKKAEQECEKGDNHYAYKVRQVLEKHLPHN